MAIQGRTILKTDDPDEVWAVLNHLRAAVSHRLIAEALGDGKEKDDVFHATIKRTRR
jgi:hypothetical protein